MPVKRIIRGNLCSMGYFYTCIQATRNLPAHWLGQYLKKGNLLKFPECKFNPNVHIQNAG